MASVIALACGLASVAALCIGWIVVTLLVLACAYWVYLRLTTRGVLSPDYAVGELLSGSLIRRVLVTGCDTGFGNKLAMQLYAQGFHVIATCRLKSSARTLAAHGDRMTALVMDVTSDKDVAAAVRKVEAGGCLWAIVNNAGIHGGAFVEWTTMEEYERVMAVNYFGAVRVTKAFLPLMKVCGGRIINVTSVLGFVVLPVTSAYSASKHALEAFSDALRLELADWNIDVCIVEPGFFDTPMVASAKNYLDRKYRALPEDVKKQWGDAWWAQKSQRLQYVKKLVKDPQLVVDAMIHAVRAKHPRARYMVGWDAKFVFSTLSYLPTAFRDAVLRLADRKCIKPAGAWVPMPRPKEISPAQFM